MADIVTSNPLSNPLQPEIIVVHSYGMQRWVSMELSREIGILANTRFLFPKELLNLFFKTVIENYSDDTSKDLLIWRLFTVLKECKDHALFASLENYLAEGGDFKRFQLAKRLSGLFDKYCMFRPDWIESWESGKPDDWQSLLWSKLQEHQQQEYLPHYLHRFRQTIQTNPSIRLPERISIFGISSFPPMHIELLYHMSSFTDIHLYFLNPTNKYWSDIRSQKEIARIQKQTGELENDLFLSEENNLLASTGKLGQQFFHLLMDNNLIDDYGTDLFVEPHPPQTLLQYIQSDIYNLKKPDAEISLSENDKSIQIHSCHSPMREVEILYDQILDILNTHKDVTPDDILVMSPDIEDYSTIIHAVFSLDVEGTQHLPFSIADRSVFNENVLVQWFFKLLNISTSRFNVADVMEILEIQEIRDRFNLHESELDTIQYWIKHSNIRWGIDESFRQKANTPATYETTWKFGLDRLLLGFAMPLQDENLFELEGHEPVSPFNEIEGTQALILGKFLDFYNRLTELVKDGPMCLNHKRTLEDWSVTLRLVLERFFEFSDEYQPEIEALVNALENLKELSEATELQDEIALDVIYEYLQSNLSEHKSRFGFLGAGITFCSMLPMRSIPFKVIAMIGMNDKAFPRILSPLSFDLMNRKKRFGDPSVKDEDRYLFLEAILSAEKIFYLSYIGQSINDNSSLTPSTLISELIYYIETGHDKPECKISKNIQTKHPLQAFNPRYFDQKTPGLFSYSKENLNASIQFFEKKDKLQPFITELPEKNGIIELDAVQFIGFFANPCKYLINERLGIYLEEIETTILDHEPFKLDHLDKYLIQEDLLLSAFTPEDYQKKQRKYAAIGQLPLGNAGIQQFQAIQEEVEQFQTVLQHLITERQYKNVSYDFEMEGIRFKGDLTCTTNNEIMYFRIARLKTKDRLKVWINHLILQFVTDKPVTSLLIMNPPGVSANNKDLVILKCSPVDNPVFFLKHLISFFKRGFQTPLAFFPQTSAKYLETLSKKTLNTARIQAEIEWYGDGEFKMGEFENPYFHLAFKHQELFETGFEKIGREILEPVLLYQNEIDVEGVSR